MSKSVAAILIFSTICSSFPCASSQVAQVQKSDVQTLGNSDHIVYIDIDKLQTNIKRDVKPVTDLYNSKLKPESFYHEWKWRPDDCWGGTLRAGVVAYCLPYVKLGYHVSEPYYRQVDIDMFVSIGPCSGTYVWYDIQKNTFYLWGDCWNFEYAFGPFIGDPNFALRKAVKPSKGKRQFPGVSLTVVSQRWVYPDERQARMPRDEHYDCAHGHLSGRAIEGEKLNSFITRIRLVNNGAAKLYYLMNPSDDNEPVGYGLTRYAGRPDWDRTLLPLRFAEGKFQLKWRPFPPGAAIEFEVINRGWRGAEHAFVVVLNDEPIHWDEVELLGTYPTMFRTLKDERGALP